MSDEEADLCYKCRTTGRTRCRFLEDIEYLQEQVPTEIVSRRSLDRTQAAVKTEMKLHEQARQDGCRFHNDVTLRLPKFPDT